jgi:hypothetical protein
MKTVNAEIKVDITRLNYPLKTLYTRQHSAYRICACNVPGDLLGVFLRLISADGASFQDFTAIPTEDPTRWMCTIPAFAVPDAGFFTYELHADADGEKTALGRGTISASPFTAGGVAPAVGEAVVVAKMPTKDGGWVNCWATMDETGEYTYEFERITEDA